MSQKRRHHPRSHTSSRTPNHRTPIVERLGGVDAVLGRVRSPQPRGNIRFDRSPGGLDSLESRYNGSKNTHRRTNGGYQRVGDRKGRQQWVRRHRTGALHNSVGGYARTRELNPCRDEAKFSLKNGRVEEDQKNLLVTADSKYKQQKDFANDRGKQEQPRHDKERKKHNKDAKTGIPQSQKQDGCPSKDLTLPELSVNLSELYDKLKGKLSKPFPMKPDTEGRRDKSKKCKYHNDFGHTLNDCYAFKKEISRMADGGQLKEYLKGSQKLAHVNLIEHDVIAVSHAQAAACSSNHERKWSMKCKI
ncbi:hypothetical protein IFM89_009343 [Coptis chinensis]|uniref:Uncharacterized protein n=1 Tax=Coptis chinensis TaxID=261450 RepID=A0A835LLV8_9MAGN|nr:hypothetical protein IFM89_009343 [Coptis chinensis]